MATINPKTRTRTSATTKSWTLTRNASTRLGSESQKTSPVQERRLDTRPAGALTTTQPRMPKTATVLASAMRLERIARRSTPAEAGAAGARRRVGGAPRLSG